MAGPKPKSERNKPLQLDDAAFDALTALIAVRDGLATEAQVEAVLAEKKRRSVQETSAGAEAPKPKRLAYMLADEGILDDAKAKELEKRLDPEVLPGYRILGEAGRGGMGTVFKARQLSMDRIVALKILANRLSKDERYVEKFLHEARAAGKLNHEHIVSAIDCGAASGLHYFVMEFVDGKTAMELLAKDGPFTWEKAFEYGEQVGRALEHAHANGLVHRDVKPENVMVSQTVTGPRVKLCDLGLAKEAMEAGTGEKSKMTEGTPAYASPEQALGRTDIDGRSDVYSLGATLYHLLSGEAPYDGENARTILWKQVNKPFPNLDEKLPNVPAPFRALLAKMVEKDRDQRLPSARAFIDEVAKARKAVQNPTGETPAVKAEPTLATKQGRLLAAAVVLLLACVVPLAYFATRTPPEKVVEVANTSSTSKTPDKAPDDPDAGKKPRVVHLDGTDDPDPKYGNGKTESATKVDPSAGAGDEKAKAAQLLLDRANQFHEQNPDDVQGYAGKLRSVVDSYPGTPAAVVAASDLGSLESQGRSAVEKDLEKAKSDALDLASKGKFKDAISTLEALSEKWDARVLTPLKPSIEKARQLVLDQAKNRIAALGKEGDAHLAKGEPIDDTVQALLALEKELPAPLAKDAHARADDLKLRLAQGIADAALKEATVKRDAAFAAGQCQQGEDVAAATLTDARFQARKKELDAFVAETAEVARCWHAFDDKVKSFEPLPKRTYRRKGVAPVEGQLKEYEPVGWTIKVKPFGLKDLVSLDVRDFPGEDLIDLACATKDPADLHAAAAFFLARHETEVAATALDRAVAAGAPDDAALRARIASFFGQDHELKAQRLVGKALAPGAVNAAPEDVIAAVKALVATFADTQSYADKLDDLKKVYVASRVARILGPDVAHVFSGRVTRGSKDTVKIDYDFQKDAGQLKDWVADPQVTKDSALKWVKGRAYMKGVVRNVAVWEGGSLQLDARIISPSGSRPNVNFIISTKATGWDGLFVGFGFKTLNLDLVRVDPKAPNKPGWKVVTPCNVAIDLNGQPVQNAKVLVAEEEPKITQGSAIRYSIKRDSKGNVSGTMGSSTPVYVAAAPHSDEPGQIAICGLETELVVEHVELVGKLDTQWLGDRARAHADAEAAQFPAPVKTPGKGNGG